MHKAPSAGSEQLSFYRKMAELQEKLKRSEEERSRLETRFGELVYGSRTRNDERLSILRHEYANILDRERRRKARNEKIMSGLENIERHTSVINAKTEHLKLMRRQFDSYMVRKYPDFKISRKSTEEGVPYEPIPAPFRPETPQDVPWKTPFYQEAFSSSYKFSPRQRDTIYSPYNPRDNMSIFAKPMSTPMDRPAYEHEQPQDDSDPGSVLWNSMNDVKPLNLTSEEAGLMQGSDMRNIEEDLSRLLLDSTAGSLPQEPAPTANEGHVMERLTRITKEIERQRSVEGAEEEPGRCQSSMGMLEKSLELHEETKKLLEETSSPRKVEEVQPKAPVEMLKTIQPEMEDEEDILYAESIVDTLPEPSEPSEQVTQDVTYSDQVTQDATYSQEPVDYAQSFVSETPMTNAPSSEATDLDMVPQGPEEFITVAQEPVELYQQEQLPLEEQLVQQYNQQVQPGAMYGYDESSVSTSAPSADVVQSQQVEGGGFQEYELQPVEPQEETLAEYDSSEMTGTTLSHQPEQLMQVAEPYYDEQSVSQATTNDEVEQQIADILTHAPTAALPPAPPGRTGASPTSSSWGKLKNLGASGALKSKSGSPTSSRAGSAKSSPGSRKSTTPPNKSPSSKTPSPGSGTKSPVAKKSPTTRK